MAAVTDRWTGVRRGAGALCLALAFVLSVSTAVAPPALADQAITSSGPLTRIFVSSTLNCAVSHVLDPPGEFFGDAACGTFVVVGDKIYGPAVGSLPGASFLTTAPNYEPFTPLSQTGVLGTGTAADPYRIVTVVSADGLIITETDSYVVGQESYRTDITVTNNTATGPITIYRAGDCFLQSSDQGYGSVDPATGSVACVAPNPADPNEPGSRIIQWRPITPGSHYFEALPSQVWAAIATGLPFPDTCRCTELIDNGAGLSWTATIPQGGAQAFSHVTVFSPAGVEALTITKTADSPTVAVGATTGYTITITNPTNLFVNLSSLTDTLPPGFVYVSGTSTGLTTIDPIVSGQTLRWPGQLPVGPHSTVTLHFNVVAPATPGTYFNTVAADGGPITVVPTGSTAPIVVGAAQATTTSTTTAGGSTTTSTTTAGGSTTTSTTAGGSTTTSTTTAGGSTTSSSTTAGGSTTSSTAAAAGADSGGGSGTGSGSGSGSGSGMGGSGTGASGSGTGASGSGSGSGSGGATTGNPLARTGSDSRHTASVAVGVLTIGGILLVAGEDNGPRRARRRPGSPRGTWSP